MNRSVTYCGLFALLFFCMTYVHQKRFDAPTPVSRLDLLHALVVHGTVSIDAYHLNTPDKAEFEGRYYSDKAPGTVALAFVPFALSAAALAVADIDLNSETGWLFSSWVACAGSIGILTALGGLASFAWLSRHVSSRAALVTVLGLFLGAAPLPYATMMFSHALVVGLLCIAIWAVGRESELPERRSETGKPLTFALSPSEGERETNRTLIASFVEGAGEARQVRSAPLNGSSRRESALISPPGRVSGLTSAATGWVGWRFSQDRARAWMGENRWSLVAGLACGWALASEYSSGLMVIGVALWMVMRMGWRRLVPFGIAMVPPLLLIPAYSWACFGTPFTLPYSHQASFPQMQEGVYAIKWPDAGTAFNLLFTPSRGLFFWTPFLVLAGFGYWRLIQDSPRLFWLTYALPLLHIVVISGRVWDWPAGPTLGPRLLAPILPWLALPCAYGVWRFPKLGMLLAGYSIGITSLATLTDACPSFLRHPNPLFDLHIPLFLEGEFCPTLGAAFGLPAYGAIAVYYAVLIGGAWWLWWRLGVERETGMERQAAREQTTNLGTATS